MTHNQPTNFPFHRSLSTDLTPQPPTRSFFNLPSNTANPPASTSAPASFQRRTVESARQLRDSFTNVIREIEPFVEPAMMVNARVANFLNLPHTEGAAPRPANEADSYYINVDVPENATNTEPTDDAPNRQIVENNPLVTDNNNTEDQEQNQAVIDAQQFIKVLLKYVPFVLILLAKSVYDYHEAIFVLIILFITFVHTNSVVKKETIKRQRRSVTTLGLNLFYIMACLVFVHYVFSDDLHDFNVVLNLVLIRSFNHPLTVWNLLWIVTITDFTLKLLTVSLKLLLTTLPDFVLEFKKRGKMYLFIEAISQLYRSIASIQPWLYYLLESYQGPEKIVAVFLSAFYMISKGSDLMSRVKLLKVTFLKLLQNVSIGSSPSKDQIQTAGEHCPICHDEYETPVLLQCRHIFCENCVTTWFDREQTCPLCRAKIVDDPSWRDGSTSYFMQLY
ncbi:unnamed protein product [Phyllotreta striolata]|uniref:RING-type domain-containing protein n=1 Tax=Phyllotreta striolata TaxID=444603 RepID=A0A9N9XI36_PHYSR|nr:unnamed protein product [Phyllotreta striolata]